MAKSSRRSPGVGRNTESVAGDDAWLKALAMQVLANTAKEMLTEQVKAVRKGIEALEVPLDDLDFSVKHRNAPPSDIIKMLKNRLRGFLAFMPGLRSQTDLFMGAPPPAEVQAAFIHAGIIAAIEGRPCDPPQNLDGQEAQSWQDGWHQGSGARTEVLKDPKVKKLHQVVGMLAAKPAEPNQTAGASAGSDKPKPRGAQPLSEEARAKALAAAGPDAVDPPKADPPAPAKTLEVNTSAQAAADFAKDAPAPGATPPAERAGDPKVDALSAQAEAIARGEKPKSQNQIAAERRAAAGIG